MMRKRAVRRPGSLDHRPRVARRGGQGLLGQDVAADSKGPQ